MRETYIVSGDMRTCTCKFVSRAMQAWVVACERGYWSRVYTFMKTLDEKKLTQNTLAIRRKLPTVCKNLRGGRAFAQEGHTCIYYWRVETTRCVIEHSKSNVQKEMREGGETLWRVYNTCT